MDLVTRSMPWRRTVSAFPAQVCGWGLPFAWAAATRTEDHALDRHRKRARLARPEPAREVSEPAPVPRHGHLHPAAIGRRDLLQSIRACSARAYRCPSPSLRVLRRLRLRLRTAAAACPQRRMGLRLGLSVTLRGGAGSQLGSLLCFKRFMVRLQPWPVCSLNPAGPTPAWQRPVPGNLSRPAPGRRRVAAAATVHRPLRPVTGP